MQFWLDKADDLQEGTYGVAAKDFSGDKLDDFIRWNFLAVQVELGEALQETNWKPWKPGHIDVTKSRDAFIEELVDSMFFLANIFNAYHISGEELVETYIKKYGVNQARGIAGLLKKTVKETT